MSDGWPDREGMSRRAEVSDAVVTEADRAAAKLTVGSWQFMSWRNGEIADGTLAERIAQAIAKARSEENEACERIASEAANMHEQTLGYYGEAPAACDAVADEIGKRRSP